MISMGWLKAAKVLFSRSHPATPARSLGSVLDTYCRKAPDPQNAVDIFAGEWASRFPTPLDGVAAGSALLFEDARLTWAIDRLGGVKGTHVLELGPLEGGHTYMLDRRGAAEVLSIEANTHAYLKCLIAKELLGIPAGRFVCGDFVAYLQSATKHFDFVVASGVLYHMVKPVELIARIATVSDAVYLWTHYYDRDVLASRSASAHRVVEPQPVVTEGFEHHHYRHEYRTALECQGFCGGSRPYAHWLTRDDIMGALRYFGFTTVETSHEQNDHPNGPAFCVLATRGDRQPSALGFDDRGAASVV